MVTTLEKITSHKDDSQNTELITRRYKMTNKSDSISNGSIVDTVMLEDLATQLGKIFSTGARIEVKITSV